MTCLLIISLFIFAALQMIIRIARRYCRFPIPAFFTGLIDNPIRRKFIQPPEVVAERMELKPGMMVVEIGPGKGSYTIAVAQRILPTGKVYAVDIQEPVVGSLKERLERESITNIHPKMDDVYDLPFEDNSADRVFAIMALPEIPDPVKALREFHRLLKPDGMVCLSELLPDPDYTLRRMERRWADEEGLELEKEFGILFVYQLNFKKKTHEQP